jgi:RHS repeat-associated protein
VGVHADLYDDNGFLYGLERGGNRYTVATDQVGTPRLVADASGNVVRRFNHDAYGRTIPDSDPGASQSNPAFFLPIGFAGGIEDPVTGLVRFGLRDYDTAAGRWTARDPSFFNGSPLGLYQYAGGDPVDNRDPTGLFCLGGSGYLVIGGGASLCFDSGGFTTCAEYGVGIGAGVDSDVFGTGTQGEGNFLSGGVEVGSVGLSESYTLGPCPGQGTASYKLGYGFGYVGANQQVVDYQGQPFPQGTAGLQVGLEAEAKVGHKSCLKSSW